MTILTELRHFAGVLRGRVHIARPAVCDRCPAVIHELTRAQAVTFGHLRLAACPRCPNGILRPAPHPADNDLPAGHIAQAAAYYTTHGDQP